MSSIIKGKTKNMKRFFLIATTIFLTQFIHSQECLDSNIVLTSQAQVDSFKILFPDCTILPGNFEMEFTDVTNFDSMSHIVEIKGTLKLSVNSDLVSLKGLNNVRRINYLDLRTNRALLNLKELESLDSLGGINFIGNGLETLEGLEQIKYMEAATISNNAQLKNYSGLSGLVGVTGNFFNTRCDNLVDVAMPNLKFVDGILRFDFMEKLETLDGLENVESARFFAVTKSPIFRDISAILNLNVRTFELSENPMLTSCATEVVCRHINMGFARIFDNGPGCDSLEVVEMSCTPLSAISIENSNQIKIFPNPSTGQFFIDLEEVEIDQIRVHNYLGQDLLNQDFNPSSSIDLSNLDKGYYFLELTNARNRYLKKILIH